MILYKILSITSLANIFVLFVLINCETVHYTNSPNYFMRKKNFTTYKLDVPGANSITIIEANTPQPHDSKRQENRNSDLLLESGSSLNKKTVFAPLLLDKFLKEYNIKVSTHLHSPTYDSATGNNNSNRILKRNYDDFLETEENYHNQKHNYYDNHPHSSIAKKDSNPFNEKEGWVTLQAVPWSKSKVSKWKPKAEVQPVDGNGNGYNLYDDEQKSNYNLNNDGINTRPNYDNLRPNLYNSEDEYTNNKNYNENRHSTKPTTVPWNRNDYYDKPLDSSASGYEKPEIEVASNYDRWYDYGFRPDLENRFNQKPLFSKPTFNQQQYNLNENANIDNDFMQNSGSYIKDSINRNADRHPKPYSYRDRISSSESQYSNHFINRHPMTHPSNGKGEWVLVSTTKGYQHRPSPTRSVPRGIKYNNSNTDSTSATRPSLSHQPLNYRTHKSIKLTVLPAETEDGKLKPMKLSHGGLIEVESSVQSVEDSAAASKNKKKKVVKRKAGMVPMQFVPITSAQKIDKNAILAAVSAGMVPASMAMLMPFVLGRKKRSLSNDIYKKNFKYDNILRIQRL